MSEPLAQLAEHRTFNPGVPGSSPGRLTIFAVLSSRGLGHRPFKAATRVRISLGPPIYFTMMHVNAVERSQGQRFIAFLLYIPFL